MTTRRKMFTADEFEQFVKLPQNVNRRFEYINGELVEVPSNPYSSQIAALIIAALVYFLRGKNLGHVTGEQGGCPYAIFSRNDSRGKRLAWR